MKKAPKKRRQPHWPQACFLIERHEVPKALCEFENDSASLCIYISGGEEDGDMKGLHLMDGELTLSVRPWRGTLTEIKVMAPKAIPAAQAEAMTPPCFQTVQTYDKAGKKLGGEAYRWGVK